MSDSVDNLLINVEELIFRDSAESTCRAAGGGQGQVPCVVSIFYNLTAAVRNCNDNPPAALYSPFIAPPVF